MKNTLRHNLKSILIKAAVITACFGVLGCGQADLAGTNDGKKLTLSGPVPIASGQSGVREIGGDRIDQARAFLIVGNLSSSPGEFLNYIKECRADTNYHAQCERVILELERSIAVYAQAKEAGNVDRLFRQLKMSLTAPVGETIIGQPAKPIEN